MAAKQQRIIHCIGNSQSEPGTFLSAPQLISNLDIAELALQQIYNSTSVITKQRESRFLLNNLVGIANGNYIPVLWNGACLRVNDKLFEAGKETEGRITIKEGALQFLVLHHESANR